MDGVLEGAAEMCMFKLASSLLIVPLLTTPNSPVSFCCCCLLLFTDFLVAVYLNVLWASRSWWTALTPADDGIALRFLLFQSHIYGAVLFLIIPLMAAETITRRLWPCSRNKDRGERFSPAVSYLCCLSLWVAVALNVRWRWVRQEKWTAACLSATNSFVRCLPNLFNPIPRTVSAFWGSAFVLILLVLLTTSTSLQRMTANELRRTKRRLNCNSDTRQQGFIPTCSAPSKPVNGGMPESAQRVDPEKTESSCNVERKCSGNIVQMLAHHHRDFVLVSHGCLSAEREGHEFERTKEGIPLTFIGEGHKDSQCKSQLWQRGFPCLWVKVMIGLVGVLSIYVLPMNLSVNILLIRGIDMLLELGIGSLVDSVVKKGAAPASYIGTFV